MATGGAPAFIDIEFTREQTSLPAGAFIGKVQELLGIAVILLGY